MASLAGAGNPPPFPSMENIRAGGSLTPAGSPGCSSLVLKLVS